jgi:trans-AT polyketide synthase, acyltransferase and oxidoreductase domains
VRKTQSPVRDAANDAGGPVEYSADAFRRAAQRPRAPVVVALERATRRVGVAIDAEPPGTNSQYEVFGVLPPLYPEWLGGRSFTTTHGVRFPYVAGEMANGIATTRMVAAMAEADMLGFFGAAGLDQDRVTRAALELASRLGQRRNWGVNLIHSPQEPELEERVADALLTHSVPNISASAFMKLTPAVVRCAAAGLRTDAHGQIQRKTHLFAKVSRREVAEQFLSPAPRELLEHLVTRGQLTRDEAMLAAHVPVAEDITVEADSGGHTDNRPLVTVLPAILALRNEIAARFRYSRPVRIGAAGGLGTPDAVAAAFLLGASYVVTGSINQATVESGLSEPGKALLADAEETDVTMAPASDMFELGVQLQVLRRGTLFATRANRLYELYQRHPSLDAIPADVRGKLEREILHDTIDNVWQQTARYWQDRDPKELQRADRDPRHRMALLFRSYLGQSSHWAIEGNTDRHTDYQIWCGPAMGAFNQWVRGSFLARPESRTVVQIALNLMEGATVATRAHQLRASGVPLSDYVYRPRKLG